MTVRINFVLCMRVYSGDSQIILKKSFVATRNVTSLYLCSHHYIYVYLMNLADIV